MTTLTVVLLALAGCAATLGGYLHGYKHGYRMGKLDSVAIFQACYRDVGADRPARELFKCARDKIL